MSFVVFALPRSRTYWLSRFLSYRDWICSHEEIARVRSLEDVRCWFRQPCVGTIETAGAPWWRLLRHHAPDAKIALVRRPVAEVMCSLDRLKMPMDRAAVERYMVKLDRKLDQIEQRTDALSVTFDELKTEDGCARLFEHCLPYSHDSGWWHHLSPHNLQTSVEAIARYYRAYEPQLVKIALIAKQQTISSMARRERHELDGITFQQEPFEKFYTEGQALFRDHLALVGEAPIPSLKNIAMFRALDAMGAMHITTARCNGRMFGYLMSVLSPSLEANQLMTGIHNAFYADPSVPGLGLRLERASIASMRELGIREVYMRAGVRGSGPKMGALYRRLGAERFGDLYKLDLKDF